MSDRKFPSNLKPIVNKGYSHKRGGNIARSQVQSGLPRQSQDRFYDSAPVNINLYCNCFERSIFYMFINSVSGGADSFGMMLDTGYGIEEHQVVITSEIGDSTQDGLNFAISFTATTEKVPMQDLPVCYTDTMLEFFECYGAGFPKFLNDYMTSLATFPFIIEDTY